MKHENKNQRAKVGAANNKSLRKLVGKSKRLDTEYYQNQVGDGFRVVWIVDRNNDLQDWLDAGATHIDETKSTKKGETSSVRVFAGTDHNGNQEWQYALKVPVDIYDEIIEMKNEEARKPIDLMEQRAMAGVGNETGINAETYAPELPSGGVGISHS